VLLVQCAADQLREESFRGVLRAGARRRVGQRRQALAGVAGLHRKDAALRAHERRVAQQARHRCPIQRCRHDEQPQVGREVGARIEAQRNSQIGLQAAFVELVENDGGDALERRITLQQPRQHALGNHLDARIA